MQLALRDMTLNLSHPQVMGILNVTPDSFSDGGRYNQLNQALLHAYALISAGATMIDVGGESTRPGAEEVSEDEEIARVVSVVEALAQRFEVFISVDTSKAGVIRESAQAGVHLINDIRSLQEPGALAAAAESGLPVCLMHMQGQPRTMHHAPHYDDLIADVKIFFERHIKRCHDAGITNQQLLLDPGFGFGKNLAHNYQLLARLSEFHRFGLPLMVGMSRKSMIGQLLNVPPDQRVIGSVACAVIAAMQGAQIIRVHDVKETVEAMRVVEATLSAKGQ
ncbi:dihydropteroate synthase [Serratia symbiotica]|uniref:dihydropteroate synthase n=1 Tax=Serratia symbiotica TaxID=138074 RepID=UPI0030D0FA74|nr:dihydropteroate synthase [Serratia symbiotica]